MLPRSIVNIRNASKIQREKIVNRYMNGTLPSSVCKAPEYLQENGLIESHVLRTEMELAGHPPDENDRAFTRSKIDNFSLATNRGSLCEVSIAALSIPLQVSSNLHIAASFFSTMVACADDYIDTEGTFEVYGAELFYVTHAYRDLVDLALIEEVESGRLTALELKEIKIALGNVTATLIKSENTTNADEYLYRKSCGDKVVSVLFPASRADNKTRGLCAEIGRKTGEAGQLIDDILDYEYDIKKSKKNFLIMQGFSISDVITSAGIRINGALCAAHKLKQCEPVLWVLGSMQEVLGLIKHRHRSGLPNTPETLRRCSSISSLVQWNVPSEQLLVWF